MTPSLPPPTRKPRDLYDGRFLLYFGAGHLVWRQNGNHLLHPFQCFQSLFGPIAFLAESGHDR